MNDMRLLEELIELLEANGVTVRQEPLGGGAGGYCVVKGERILFVDTQSSAADNAALAAQAVAAVVDIEAIYLRPEVREFIESCTRR